MTYNLEYSLLDKLGRAKKTFHGGVCLNEESLEQTKKKILEQNSDNKISFKVYVLDKSPFTEAIL